MKTLKGIARVGLALMAGISMPVLIWVGLGTALYQRNRIGKYPAGTESQRVTTCSTGNY